MQNDTIYEEVYSTFMIVFIWVELISLPFTIACCAVWIVIALRLLRKQDASRKTSGSPSESLRVHYVTALHRKRLVQYAIIIIAVACILTEVAISCLTGFDIYLVFGNTSSDENLQSGHEFGQWYNYQNYHWFYIAWFVPMLLFSQGFYWSLALIPIATKSYFNTQPAKNTQNHNKLAFIVFRSVIIGTLWLVPYTIPLGIILTIFTILFDCVLILYFFGSAYSVAKNNLKGILSGLDEMDAADSKFMSKVRNLFCILSVFFIIIMFTLLQFFVVEFIMPMVIFPNCWIGPLYSVTVEGLFTISYKLRHNLILTQVISVLVIRVVICISRALLIVLSGYAFFLIFNFQKKQKLGKKLKKVKKGQLKPASASTPLLRNRD